MRKQFWHEITLYGQGGPTSKTLWESGRYSSSRGCPRKMRACIVLMWPRSSELGTINSWEGSSLDPWREPGLTTLTSDFGPAMLWEGSVVSKYMIICVAIGKTQISGDIILYRQLPPTLLHWKWGGFPDSIPQCPGYVTLERHGPTSFPELCTFLSCTYDG